MRDIQAASDVLMAKGYRLLIANREEPWGQTVTRLLSPEGLLTGVHDYAMAPRGGSVKAPLLTTDRLRLVPLVKDDAPQIQAVFPQWGNRAPSGGQFSVAVPGRRRVSLCEHDCLTGCRKGERLVSGRFAARPTRSSLSA
ncbi:Glyoxalase/bleomycin resistance protein/dioxygenase [Raoultella ornithinolytica]|nr:Glyoxalase/bleomycin resistance protein/dioxygenase [Raoultella ornithinolytica]